MQCVEGGTHGASSAWNTSCAAQTSQQVTSNNVLALYCSSSYIISAKCILAQ